MKHGDLYHHFKGHEYFFDRIALPIENTPLTKLTHVGEACYHENTHDLNLFVDDNGTTFIDATYPHVIYQAEEDYNTEKVWAREIDDFFGYKQLPDGTWVKKFTRKEKYNG